MPPSLEEIAERIPEAIERKTANLKTQTIEDLEKLAVAAEKVTLRPPKKPGKRRQFSFDPDSHELRFKKKTALVPGEITSIVEKLIKHPGNSVSESELLNLKRSKLTSRERKKLTVWVAKLNTSLENQGLGRPITHEKGTA